MLVLSAVLAMPAGLLPLVYPPAIPETLWGHPFDQGTAIVISVLLVVVHLLKAYGFIGLSRLDGAGALVRGSMLVASVGFVILAVCEALSATIFGVPLTAPEAVNLNNGYGAGSMIEALASMVGGVVIARKRLLEGSGRWSVFASGAFMVFVVTPALFTGRTAIAFVALTAWSLFYVWIGRAMLRTERA